MSPILAVLVIALLGIFGTIGILYVRYLYLKNLICRMKRKSKSSQASGEEPDVIIIGAGLAGSALATVLARDGRNVVLIERSPTPVRSIAGMGWMAGCLRAMKELGLEEAMGKFNDALLNKIHVHSPNRDSILDIEPFIMALNYRGVLAIRNLALAESRCRFIHGSVRELLVENGSIKGIRYKSKNDEETKVLRAALTVVADGKNSLFRKVNMKVKPKVTLYFTGFDLENKGQNDPLIMQWVMTQSGPVWISPNDKSNMFIQFAVRYPHDKDLYRKTAPEIPEWKREMFLDAIETKKLDRTTCYSMPPVGNFVPGVICLGDAYSTRDAVSASGMAIALRDTKSWRALLRDIPDLNDYNAMYAAQNVFSMERKSYSFTNDLFAHFIYHMFCPNTDGERLLGAGYEAYMFVPDQPERLASLMTLVALTETRPKVFFYHYFGIVLHAMLLAIKAEGWLRLPSGLYKAALVLATSFRLIVPNLYYEILSLVAPWAKPGM